MAEGQLVAPRADGSDGPTAGATAPWRSVVSSCALAAGPFDPGLLAAWQRELDDVQRRVMTLRGDVPVVVAAADPLPVGVHALLTLAGARLGAQWLRAQLVDAAAAVELAHRAVTQHEAVRDRPSAGLPANAPPPVEPLPTTNNKEHVLGGDWSITQAARLVADIGPSAYRLLVRGWGAAQLTRLETGASSDRNVLFDTAISLGALAAGVPIAASGRSALDRGVAAQVLDWAVRL